MFCNQYADHYLSGTISRVENEHFYIKSLLFFDYNEIRVNYGIKTQFKNLFETELKEGLELIVAYDGKMTMSLPPQIYAVMLKRK